MISRQTDVVEVVHRSLDERGGETTSPRRSRYLHVPAKDIEWRQMPLFTDDKRLVFLCKIARLQIPGHAWQLDPQSIQVLAHLDLTA